MKHNRTTINVAFAKSDEEGKKELLKHWAELEEIRDSPKNLSLEKGHDVVPDLIKEILVEGSS